MNSLFPEEAISINFSVEVALSIDGNKKSYFIGKEYGFLSKHESDKFSGYEFKTTQGHVYFLSKSKDNYPREGYQAVFYIQSEDNQKLSLDVIQKCKKELRIGKQPSNSEILASWDNSFQYKQEKRNLTGEIIQYGLRPPQIGALHSVLAHWSISDKPALVVMPTGTGKTETMLCLLIANQCNKTLVIVPSDSLRTQISKKYIRLGILKQFGIVSKQALYPKVSVLKNSIDTMEDTEKILDANVIVSTPHILTSLNPHCSCPPPNQEKSAKIQQISVNFRELKFLTG